MTWRGKRSPEAIKRREQHKAARQYIFTMSFNDYLISETVSRTDPEEVTEHLESVFGFADMSAVPCTFKGVVISDAYGNGAFQK